ncbi:MAG: ABC transporter substrate-binding protein [Ectothiorhodospiraceae bacterium]|nr:ABC transporter substrate-binding protein [Chromatiales bacterium]MCP5154709.1 ABC transporter substrate-binding protein [Ectothiorhodospiraceae bacterium]
MNVKKLAVLGLGAVAALSTLPMSSALAQNEQFVPMLVYRTGPYAPNGIPFANGFRDYMKLVNARDGGVGGVAIVTEECETQYNTQIGVECYEKLKGKGPTGATVFNPLSTGITYQLIPKSAVDKIPILSMGYGQTAAADGRVFPYTFNFPTTYWSQASAFVKYIGDKEGGMDKLKGKKIALVYHNSAYGKEPIPTLETLRAKYGYDLQLLAVDHPGQEQKSTWLQIRRYRPDWVIMWGWGVMNQVAVKEAAAINFPMDRFIGVWWSGSENDVIPAGDGAKGYLAGTFHAPGHGFPVHADLLKHIYSGNEAEAKANNWGEVLYNRGVVNAMYVIEALRAAQAIHGAKPLTGEQVRDGLEALDLTADRLKALGMDGFVSPLKVSCLDHETMGPVRIQQWDGEKWSFVSEWIEPMRDVVRPQVEEAAAAYAKENGITPRTCG